MLEQYGNSVIRKVDKEDEDYLLAYKAEMLKVQNKLDIVRNKTNYMKTSLNAEDYIAALEHSLAWFKEEARRLAEGCEEQKHDIEFWNEKISLFEYDIKDLNSELKKITDEVKTLEIASGQADLISEMRPQTANKFFQPSFKKSDDSLKPQTATAKERLNYPKICHVVDYMLRNNEEKGRITEEVCRYHKAQAYKNNDIIKNVEQKIVQISSATANTDFSKHMKKTALLEIFLNSVDRVKSQITRRVTHYKDGFFKPAGKRRAFSAVGQTKKQRLLTSNLETENLQVKLSNFTATDKKAVFIQFMNSPEVYEKIRQIINIEIGKEAEKQEVKTDQSEGGIFEQKGSSSNQDPKFSTYTELLPQNNLRSSLDTSTNEQPHKFTASHLYSVPHPPDGFKKDSHPKNMKRKKINSHSFYGNTKNRPSTVGTALRGLNYPSSNPNNASFTIVPK